MPITPHMLVGAAIGTQSPNLLIAFCLGLVSHYLLDALPHWDYLPKDWLRKIGITRPDHFKKIGLDFILGAMIVSILTWSYPQKLLILAGITAALLPDFFQLIYYTFKIKWLKPLSRFHKKIHLYDELPFRLGFPAILIVSLIAILSLVLI